MAGFAKTGSKVLFHDAVQKVALINNQDRFLPLLNAYLNSVDRDAFDVRLFQSMADARNWIDNGRLTSGSTL